MLGSLGDADREILADFVRTRDKTIELLARVPAEWLSRHAEGERHPLGKLFEHIAGATTWWMHRVMRDGGGIKPAEANTDPAAIREFLVVTRDRLTIFFGANPAAMGASYAYPRPDGATRPLTGRWCVLYLIQHEAHHRGKIVLALRQWGCNDIPFLPYSGWD